MRFELSFVFVLCVKFDVVVVGWGIVFVDNSIDSVLFWVLRRSVCGSSVSRILSAALRFCVKNNSACFLYFKWIVLFDFIVLNEILSFGSLICDILYIFVMCLFGLFLSLGFDD